MCRKERSIVPSNQKPPNFNLLILLHIKKIKSTFKKDIMCFQIQLLILLELEENLIKIMLIFNCQLVDSNQIQTVYTHIL